MVSITYFIPTVFNCLFFNYKHNNFFLFRLGQNKITNQFPPRQRGQAPIPYFYRRSFGRTRGNEIFPPQNQKNFFPVYFDYHFSSPIHITRLFIWANVK